MGFIYIIYNLQRYPPLYIKKVRCNVKRYFPAKNSLTLIKLLLFIPFVLALALLKYFIISHSIVMWTSMLICSFLYVFGALIWLLIVKIIACFHTDLGFSDGFITAKYCRFFEYHCIIVPVEKIVMVQVRQTKNQKRTKNCNLVLLTNAEKPKLHKIKNMPLKETMEFLRRNDIHIL